MSASQLDLIVDQVKLLRPDEIVRLIRQIAEVLEQKQSQSLTTTNYANYFGAGKGVFSTPEEVDQFIRAERDAWDE
ncbi:MAG: hypothetical protein SF339_21860 [Blastocatellia bacterium]|nr:hypothetical protein [Blastocatellia bacterium]